MDFGQFERYNAIIMITVSRLFGLWMLTECIVADANLLVYPFFFFLSYFNEVKV